MKILVTGGAGFIGSRLIRHLILSTDHEVVNVDRLTYAGNTESLKAVSSSPRYAFERVDVCSFAGMEAVFAKHMPDAVMHLAAESHVDRSILGPSRFMETNIMGTFTILEVARKYREGLSPARSAGFRLHHISTDEVYGDLQAGSPPATEESSYIPSSPYAASKASSDHLVRAWHRTYGLDTVITNCSNNFGPFQFPEKLIPLMILNAKEGRPLPVYGQGNQVRDWLFVDDHVRALCLVLEKGRPGETYNIGAHNERRNIDVVEAICRILDDRLKDSPHVPHAGLISHVADRPGHDVRYAINAGKITRELGWQPTEDFDSALQKTIDWYLSNRWWWEPLRSVEASA